MRRRIFIAAVLGCLLACWTGVSSAQIPAKDRLVVLISLDGFPAEAFSDPRLPAPTLRRLAREGAQAARMTVVNPSVTWPNHTSMVTGVVPARHGVLFNGMLVRTGPNTPPRVEPWRDKKEMVRVATVYDAVHQAGLTTAQVDWVAIMNAPTINWEFAERPRPGGPIEQELVAAGVLSQADVEEFAKGNGPWKDDIWTKAAAHIVKRHKPNLLLYHLLNLDSTHHRYGFRTPASFTGMALADARVADLLQAIESAGMRERTTVLVVSDHGFKTVLQNIKPNAALRQQGLVTIGEGGKVECQAWVIPEGGTAMVYITNTAEKPRLAPRVKEILVRLEGIARVIEPAEFASLGLPHPAKYEQMADFVLTAADGYAFSALADGEPVVPVPPAGSHGTHGYVSTDRDMDAMLIAWGYGIQPGTKLERVSNLDLAPTIARLLGVKLDGTEGRVLREFLKPQE